MTGMAITPPKKLIVYFHILSLYIHFLISYFFALNFMIFLTQLLPTFSFSLFYSLFILSLCLFTPTHTHTHTQLGLVLPGLFFLSCSFSSVSWVRASGNRCFRPSRQASECLP